MSSGEDDLGEIQAWNNSKNSSNNDSGAICGGGQHQKSADNQQQQWTYIAVTPSSEESIPIHTSSFKSVVSNLLPPGSAVNGENDFDPSLTELNAILEGKDTSISLIRYKKLRSYMLTPSVYNSVMRVGGKKGAKLGPYSF